MYLLQNDTSSGEPIPGRLLLSRACFRFGSTCANFKYYYYIYKLSKKTAIYQITKKFEIRTFYLNENFYSMAIFSQNDEKTKTDFRNYNQEKPNRNVPYKLPIEIEAKLKKFMNRMNLNSGSIDIIYSDENEYIFLEVNVVGQFAQVSYPCNYQLEKVIAQSLN